MNMRNLFVLLALALFTACSNDNSTNEESTEEKVEAESAAENTASSESVMRSGDYTLTPMSPSPSYPDAAMESMSYSQGNWKFEISGESYNLGVQTDDAGAKGCANSAKGQHIHLIVDNAPYAAKYESEFEYEIADGKHAVLAFLSRSYHESIKSITAYKADMLYVQDNETVRSLPIADPFIFYSRPKGVYEGEDTKRVMLDYYLLNTTEDHYVMADINGTVFKLTNWQPYIIEGLPAGDNKITLTLMDKNGKVATGFNPVSREFKLNP